MTTDVQAMPHVASLDARSRAMLLAFLVAAFVMVLNETVLNVALPTLMTEFQMTSSVAQWLATAYMLTMAVVIPTTGFLMQRLTSRAVFFLAMGTFIVGAGLAGVAPSFEVLLLARVAQASGTAIMLPLLLTTVLTVVSPERRGAAMGTVTVVTSVAPALGPTLSGLILHTLSWRYLFLLVLPIALGALVYGARVLVNMTEPQRPALDILSVPLAAVGFGATIYALSLFGESSANGPGTPVGVFLGLGVLSLACFTWRQLWLQRRGTPLLDLRPLRMPMFTLSLLLVMVAMTALFGGSLLLPLYVQNVRGLTTVQTGLLLLPGGVLMSVLAPLVGRWYDWFGPRPLTMPGAVLLTVALVGFGRMDAQTSLGMLIALHVALSAGMALMITPAFTAGMAPLPAHLYAHGSAILSTLQQVAGAAGTALLVTVMNGQTARLVTQGTALAQAQTLGLQHAYGIAVGLALVAVVLAVFLRRPVIQVGPTGELRH